MNLDKILAISGKPGLYALKVQTRTGFVAESLHDGKKITVGLRSNVSLLSEISMYTTSGEKPLAEVMRNIAIKEDNGPAVSHKEDSATLATYFEEILPDYDQERVYPSDIKKVLNWYNILQAKGLVSKEAPVKESSTEENEASAEVETAEVETTAAEVADTPKAPKAKAKAKKE
ncbi:MAG TPA: DUF5606 domain-containing protein [Flavobacterium sp.]|jgi:hypothetical protein|nr:DUF5606 domain-containing protein [Flavobacterium sp.]